MVTIPKWVVYYCFTHITPACCHDNWECSCMMHPNKIVIWSQTDTKSIKFNLIQSVIIKYYNHHESSIIFRTTSMDGTRMNSFCSPKKVIRPSSLSESPWPCCFPEPPLGCYTYNIMGIAMVITLKFRIYMDYTWIYILWLWFYIHIINYMYIYNIYI